jgi:hypothetical protein
LPEPISSKLWDERSEVPPRIHRIDHISFGKLLELAPGKKGLLGIGGKRPIAELNATLFFPQEFEGVLDLELPRQAQAASAPRLLAKLVAATIPAEAEEANAVLGEALRDCIELGFPMIISATTPPMMSPRALGPAVLMVSFLATACGGSHKDESEAGASGGATATGGSGAAGGARATGGAGTPVGGEGGDNAEPLVPPELGDCDPLADSCAEGKSCQVREGRTACVDEGSTARDEACEDTGSCERGSICLGAGEVAGEWCQQPCSLEEEPWGACDIARHTCFVALDDQGRELPFGVCRY